VSRFVVDADVLTRILGGELEVSEEHELLAPTLVRSQVLSRIYADVRRGEMSEKDGRERLERLGKLKIRLLGDAVLREVAWKMAEELDWESTFDAEYLALTRLQADALVTSNEELRLVAEDLVETAPVDDLRRP
jgi:predicted nucleic acid-binding protein